MKKTHGTNKIRHGPGGSESKRAERRLHPRGDRPAGENTAQLMHGWPQGVSQAVIVITSADEDREIYRQLTPRLHNNIRMPEGSHGRQFVIKAAFLRHVDDEPVFGSSPTFTMPFSTEDFAARLDSQHHADFEAQVQEVEC
ncbi:MAG: hypothetical protein LBS04_03545 [Tannerellaceae bacterium]|nr:hypothetical protein [Tannerellaceae bacterium]